MAINNVFQMHLQKEIQKKETETFCTAHSRVIRMSVICCLEYWSINFYSSQNIVIMLNQNYIIPAARARIN